MKALSFTARIYKSGINPCVDAPPEAGQIFQKRGFIPIAGLINGESYRATLVPRGGGRHRLYLNGEIRKATPSRRREILRWIFRREATEDASVSDPAHCRAAFKFAFQVIESLVCGYEHQTINLRPPRGRGGDFRD